jgi:tetrapyrrole methylase family protein/MazG family protein
MTQSPGALFERLLDIMHRLRGPAGCPWDREQTATSLKPFLIEEAYEVLEAIESGEPGPLREELGDLVLQVVFHAEIAAERGAFGISEVLAGIGDKMIRRHPHVFGEARVDTTRDVLTQWEALKQRELATQGQPRSVIGGVPRALPALLRAQRVQDKAARVNFDWPDARAAWTKVEEEVGEVAAALGDGSRDALQEELGDLLFSLVNVARLSAIDAEDALQRAIEKFRRRFTTMEDELIARGKSVASVSSEELQQCWEAVKAQEPTR